MSLEERISVLEAAILNITANSKEILTFDEACIFMGISRPQLYRLTSTNKIAFSKPSGKLIYFRREDLITYLLQNRISTSKEIKESAATYTATHKISMRNNRIKA